MSEVSQPTAYPGKKRKLENYVSTNVEGKTSVAQVAELAKIDLSISRLFFSVFHGIHVQIISWLPISIFVTDFKKALTLSSYTCSFQAC